MKRFLKGTLATSLALLLGLALAIPQADAVPMLQLNSSAGGSVTITDGGVGDSASQAGVIVFNGSLAGWSINVTTGLTKPNIGSAAVPQLDLNSVNLSGGSGSLTIEFSDTGFMGPIPNANVSGFAALIGGTTVGSVSYSTFLDPSNTVFGQAIGLTSGSFGPGAFSGTQIGGAPVAAGPYALTQVVTVSHNTSGVTSFNASLDAVPEPASMLLLGSGLVGLGLWRWKNRTK